MQQWRTLCARDKADHIVAVLKAACAARVDRVLEAGCGTAAVLREVKLAGIGSDHTGIDVVDPLAHPEPGIAEAGLSLSAYDGEIMPFADGSFDLVFASHVLEHVPDERGFLSELARVAKKWVYVEVPCEIYMRMSMRDMQNTLNIGHINAYTPETLALTLSTSGMPPLDVQIFDHSMAVHEFTSGKTKARAKAMVRRGLLAASPRMAARVFTYHCGALIDMERVRAA